MTITSGRWSCRSSICAKAAVGSRGGARDALDAEVPIDIITAAQLQSTGQTELLQGSGGAGKPGFNAPRPSITDGTDHAPLSPWCAASAPTRCWCW